VSVCVLKPHDRSSPSIEFSLRDENGEPAYLLVPISALANGTKEFVDIDDR
jgi:hypothetical protein